MLGSGNKATSFAATGSIQPACTTLPTTHPACPAIGEALSVLPSSVKLPCFISGVGTVLVIVVDRRLAKRWRSPKKKVLSFMMGPPKVPPNWFWTKRPFGLLFLLLIHE